MILDGVIAGCTSLLGSIYVVIKNSEELQRYCYCRPYSFQKGYVIRDMNPIGIATNYARICVYILDGGNRCVWRIRRNVEPSKVVEFSADQDLVSMSVTESGRIVVAWNKTKISVYNDAGEELLSTDTQQGNEVQFINHAIEVDVGSFVACNDRQLFKFSVDGKVTVDDVGGSYIVQDRNGDEIVADTERHRVLMRDSGTLKWTTLLTLELDGIESPHHVHFALDTGHLLVSCLNYVDVYSFNEKALHSHVAASEQETRDQRIIERAFLQREVSQNKCYEKLVRVHSIIAEDNLSRQRSATSGKQRHRSLRFFLRIIRYVYDI